MGLLCDFIILSLLFVRVQFECTRLIVRNMSIIKQLWHFTSRFNLVYTATPVAKEVYFDGWIIDRSRSSKWVKDLTRCGCGGQEVCELRQLHLVLYTCMSSRRHMLRVRETWTTLLVRTSATMLWMLSVVCNDNSGTLWVKLVCHLCLILNQFVLRLENYLST